MVNDDKFVEIGKENQNDHNSGIGNSQMEEMSSNKVYEFMNEVIPVMKGLIWLVMKVLILRKRISLHMLKKCLRIYMIKGVNCFIVPTGINCKGEEVVLFDEELVKEGSEKWQLIVCGYFVGCRMSVKELKYNTRRMWERYGLREIVVDVDDMRFFKFKDEEGMKYIIEQSPWIVNGKPLVVQKWDPKIVIEKEAPCKIPIWIRLLNV
nr:reverse transcriptase domain, reverse transcriptase zinc-binding domain protein [Tanacetum cinerariifolium]